MSLELIPVLVFAWLVELTQFIQANAGPLFFLPLFTIIWTGIRIWETETVQRMIGRKKDAKPQPEATQPDGDGRQ